MTAWLVRDGAYAIFLLMAVDALLPASGELTMLVGGAMAGGAIAGAHPALLGFSLAPGLETYLALSLVGVLGSLAGSLLGWTIGATGGWIVVERHGRRLGFGPEAFARAERWFERFGDAAVFVGRLTPVVRSFIAVPAGALGSRLARYVILTGAASLIWCFGFAAAGWALGSAWTRFHHDFRYAEVIAVAGTVAVVGVLARRRLAALTRSQRSGGRAQHRSDQPDGMTASDPQPSTGPAGEPR